MKSCISLFVAFLFTLCLLGQEMSQEELLTLKATKVGAVEDYYAQAAALEKELEIINAKLADLAGWKKGISGTVGFDFGNSKRWISNPNPNSRFVGLNLGLAAFLKYDEGKKFWYNNLNAQKAWNNLDFDTADGNDTGKLFSNGTVDLLNLSSLAGYKITDKLAVSLLGEWYSSIDRIDDQGVVDLGLGITWLPFSNLTVTVNPLNYHFVYTPEVFGLKSSGAIGARVRADYNLKFKLLANDCTWQSSLFGFFPYSDVKNDVTNDPADSERVVYTSSLREVTWLNNLSLELWKGIGVGFGWGLRSSGFEALVAEEPKLQSFFNFGLAFTY